MSFALAALLWYDSDAENKIVDGNDRKTKMSCIFFCVQIGARDHMRVSLEISFITAELGARKISHLCSIILWKSQIHWQNHQQLN